MKTNSRIRRLLTVVYVKDPRKITMKWNSLIRIFLIICDFLIIVKGEYYSSIHKMSMLMDVELNILENMQKFIRKNENKLTFLKERLSEYEIEREEALTSGPIYFENPVNKYLLTKRLTTDWERIENILQYKEGEKTLKKTVKHSIENAELDGAIDGLLRLQDVYRLNASDLAKGLIQGIQHNSHFDARHCYDIGQRAVLKNYLQLAYAWFNEAFKRISLNEPADSESELSLNKLEQLDIELALANIKYRLCDIQGANQTYVELINKYAANEKIAKLYAEFSQESAGRTSYVVDYSEEHPPPPTNIFNASTTELFKSTCAGIIKSTPSEDRFLRCGYLTETHAFLILAPIKVEEISHDPLLVVFYDVITDNEIDTIKNLTENIQRATIMSTNGSVVSDFRTSQFLFLNVTTHPVLATIDQRVEDMTNLNMKYSEDHQFANYGIGGHYSEHHDWFAKPHMTPNNVALFEMGNRIATVLFYLSDVEQGGGTAFPYLRRLLLPKKGAAAFWYNLHASGVGDKRTLHGACPIIVGSKWVQNRWIREHDQSDRRPCELYDDTFTA